MVTLGVGKNMVRSMRHWALATGMIEESPDVRNNRGRHLQPTDLGRTIFADDGIDPFLERKGTIWLLHYQLASNLGASATWFWAFNHFILSEFQSADLISGLEKYFAPQRESSVAHATLERDVSCFLRTYVAPKRTRTVGTEDTLDCPLVELGLLRNLDLPDTYMFSREKHQSLPPEIFAFATLSFWNRTASGSNSLGFNEIAYSPGSPGKVFKLTESAIVDQMRQMETTTRKALTFDSTAGLVQLYRKNDIAPIAVLKNPVAKGTKR